MKKINLRFVGLLLVFFGMPFIRGMTSLAVLIMAAGIILFAVGVEIKNKEKSKQKTKKELYSENAASPANESSRMKNT